MIAAIVSATLPVIARAGCTLPIDSMRTMRSASPSAGAGAHDGELRARRVLPTPRRPPGPCGPPLSRRTSIQRRRAGPAGPSMSAAALGDQSTPREAASEDRSPGPRRPRAWPPRPAPRTSPCPGTSRWGTGCRWSGPQDRTNHMRTPSPGNGTPGIISVPCSSSTPSGRGHLLHDELAGVGVAHAHRPSCPPGRADPAAPERRTGRPPRSNSRSCCPSPRRGSSNYRPGRTCSRRPRHAGRRRRRGSRPCWSWTCRRRRRPPDGGRGCRRPAGARHRPTTGR